MLDPETVAGDGLSFDRWRAIWRRVVVLPDDCAEPGRTVFADLARRYAEPARHYHNARHIVDCLRLFDEVKARVADPVALELAIWWHDAIYDSRAADNEERSAGLAAEMILRAGGSAGLAARVHALVLTTRTHEPGAVVDAPWLLDIDLATLGAALEVFDAYDAAIRAEYSWVGEAAYREKRVRVLASFLARPRIYRTSHFQERFEAAARANLQSAIARLQTG